MKKTLLLLFTVACLPAFAQIVNIPDANFKSRLLSGSPDSVTAYNAQNQAITVDSNNDGQIQLSEAQAVYKMELFYHDIYNITGIEAFTNLRRLVFELPVTSADLSALTHLEYLDCSFSDPLTTLNIAGLTNLKYLDCHYTHVNSLALQGMVALEKINARQCPLTSLNLTGLSSLQEVTCSEAYTLNSLTLSGNTALKKLDCNAGGHITALNLAAAPNLEYLNCDDNDIYNLNVSGLASLKTFICSNNNISNTIDLTTSSLLTRVDIGTNNIPALLIGDAPALERISAFENHLQQIQFGYLPSVQFIDLADNNLSTIDVSSCPQLQTLFTGQNPLTYLNVKNGNTSLNFSGEITTPTTPFLNICTDEGEEAFFINYFSVGLQQVNVTTYCSFSPGGSYNTISGITTYNAANNGCNEALPLIRYSISGAAQNGLVIGSQSGNYSFYPPAGTFTITPQLENSSWFTVTPSTATVTFANANNNTATQNFCISPNGNHPDVEITVSPITNAQPGFDALYRITYKNKGNQMVSGDVVFAFDDSRTDFVYATVTPNSTAPGSLSWDYINLRPFESRSVIVTLNMNGPMEMPALNNGDHLTFTASITPTGADETPTDNTFSLGQTLTGSFDPNDITCLEGGAEHPDNIGKYLHYTINFENTGTAPATFIVVKDMIDTAKFDIASLQLINASHNVKTRINGNKVEFYFDAINLGPNQKGNVLFKIKTLPSLAVNSSVTQNANIYFDYNWPITTNDATTTFQLLSSGDFAQDTSVKIYPTPSSSVVNISAATTISTVQLYDVQGRLLEAVSPKLNEATVDISQRANGIYFMKISTGNGVKIEKVIKN